MCLHAFIQQGTQLQDRASLLKALTFKSDALKGWFTQIILSITDRNLTAQADGTNTTVMVRHNWRYVRKCGSYL